MPEPAESLTERLDPGVPVRMKDVRANYSVARRRRQQVRYSQLTEKTK